MTKENNNAGTRGERLRRLRKARGLSLEEAHQRTKIHLKILRALEEDKLDEISPAYVKGLLKIYCNLLGVDPKDFMDEQPLKQESFTWPKTEDSKLPLVEKPQMDISAMRQQIKLKPIIFSICLLFLAMLAFKIGKSVFVHRQQSHPEKSSQESIAVSKQQEVISPTSVITNPRLGIRAKQDCWLEVKTNGKTIFTGVLKKGDFESWEAKDSIEFSLGNAGGVDVEVNGKLLPPLGRRGQAIRDILVTKEGLVVPQ